MTTGVCSLLFEHNARTGAMQATSGYGLDALPTDPWMPAPPEARVVSEAFSRPSPTFVPNADREMPDLSARLGTTSAMLLPLVRNAERLGLLAIGVAGAHTPVLPAPT